MKRTRKIFQEEGSKSINSGEEYSSDEDLIVQKETKKRRRIKEGTVEKEPRDDGHSVDSIHDESLKELDILLERKFLKEIVSKRKKKTFALRKRVFEIIEFIVKERYSDTVKSVTIVEKRSSFIIQIVKLETLINFEVLESPNVTVKLFQLGVMQKEFHFKEKNDLNFMVILTILEDSIPFNPCVGFKISEYVDSTFKDVLNFVRKVDLITIGINEKEFSVGVYSERKLKAWLNVEKLMVKSNL